MKLWNFNPLIILPVPLTHLMPLVKCPLGLNSQCSTFAAETLSLIWNFADLGIVNIV
jgi:hypothetical protein